MPLKKWRLSLFHSIKDRNPSRLMLREDDLKRLILSKRSAKSKDDVTCWSPAVYPDGVTRGAKNVDYIDILCFDVDGGAPFSAHRLFAARGLLTMAYTTWSHGPMIHKWRLVLPLARPIPAQDWSRAWKAALEGWEKITGSKAGPDRKCSDSSRLFFLPATPMPSSEEIGDFGTPEVVDPSAPHNLFRTAYYPGKPLRLEYKHIPVQEPPPTDAANKAVKFLRPKLPPFKSPSREARNIARTDPQKRLEIAQFLGASISGNLARKMVCPQCGRADLWLHIDPALSSSGNDHWVRCNHQKSCGYYADVFDLS